MGRTIVGTDRAWQQKIQFEDEGVAVGTPGGVNTVDFTGPGVTASEVGGVLTVNITGGGSSSITIEQSWNFNNSLSGDPGNNKFLLNNATLANVTQLNISDNAIGGFDIHTLFDILSIGDTIYVQQTNDATRIALFRITGTHTDMGGYHTLPIETIRDGGILYQNNANCSFVFMLQGGMTGSGTTYNTFLLTEEGSSEEPMMVPGPPGPAGSNGVIGRDGATIFMVPDEPEYPMMIPGAVGPAGAAGTPGTQGPPGVSVFPMDGNDGEEGFPIPGTPGPAGAAGSAGPQGVPGVAVFSVDGTDGEDGMPIPGTPGPAGSQGSIGPQGLPGIAVFVVDGDNGEDGIPIPGPAGPQGPTGPSGGSASSVEQNLGSTATFWGKFTVVNASITAGSKILIWQAPGPYTGKGTRADEMDMVKVNANAVPAAGSMTVYWETEPYTSSIHSREDRGDRVITATGNPGPYLPQYTTKRLNLVRGNVRFNYMIL